LITTVLLAGVMMTGPVVLGGARLWIELPLLGVVAVLLLIQGLRLAATPTEGEFRRADALDWIVGLFVVYTIVRWLTSPTEYFSRIEAMEVVGYAAVFFTCRYGMANRKYAVALLYLLVMLGVGEAAYGYWLTNHPDFFLYGPTEKLQLHYAPRWLGTYGCPNHYGSLLVMAIGAALALGSLSKLPWPIRIILFYLAIMMMVGVINCASRGSWLALIFSLIGLVIFGIRNGTMRWWFPVTGGVVLIAISAYLFTVSQIARDRWGELQNIVLGDNLFTYIRVELARDALRIAHDYPLFGTGPATFVFVHPRYQDSGFGFKAVLTHDDYLNCLCDYGVIGFAMAMIFFFLVTLKFFRPLGVDQRWQDRVLVSTGFAAWAALFIHSFVDFNFHIPANALMFFALIGLALGRIKEEDSVVKHWSTFSLAPLGRWLGWGVVAFSLVYGAIIARSAVSDIIYELAYNHVDEFPASQSIEAAQQALVYDPGNAQALIFLGDVYRFKADRQDDMDARLDEGQKALDAYQKALKANTLDDTIHARMGMSFDLMRRFPEAFFCYSQAATAQPYNGQFWYRLGNHFWDRSMWAKAEEAYLVAAKCPHGGTDSIQAEKELRQLPEMQDVPWPAPGTNPLSTPSATEEPSTLP
jgi:O-antigen ligase